MVPVALDTAHDSDDVLVRRIGNGDERALETLIRRYHPLLYPYVSHLLGDDGHSDDILQDVFVRLWNARATLIIQPGNVRSYLFSAAHRVALTYRARQHRQDTRTIPLDITIPDPVPWADAMAEQQDLVRVVQTVVNNLPERCRQIYLLSRDGELSYPEIANVLGITTGTVKTQMSRAMKAIYQAVKPLLVMAF